MPRRMLLNPSGFLSSLLHRMLGFAVSGWRVPHWQRARLRLRGLRHRRASPLGHRAITPVTIDYIPQLSRCALTCRKSGIADQAARRYGVHGIVDQQRHIPAVGDRVSQVAGVADIHATGSAPRERRFWVGHRSVHPGCARPQQGV